MSCAQGYWNEAPSQPLSRLSKELLSTEVNPHFNRKMCSFCSQLIFRFCNNMHSSRVLTMMSCAQGCWSEATSQPRSRLSRELVSTEVNPHFNREICSFDLVHVVLSTSSCGVHLPSLLIFPNSCKRLEMLVCVTPNCSVIFYCVCAEYSASNFPK